MRRTIPGMSGGSEPSQFTVRVEREGDAAIVTPSGELDLASAPELEQVLRGLEPPLARLVLDLSELTYIDSTGLKIVMYAQRRGGQEGYKLVLVPGPVSVHGVFQVTGIADALPFAPDRQRALTA